MKRTSLDDTEARYRPLNARRRSVLLLLAVGAAAFVMWSLTRAPGGSHARPLPGADVQRCSGTQQRDCVGGTLEVIALPAAAASAPR